MLIRCWGARGSVPVSGEQYLRYGGDTTCVELRTRDGQTIVIDAGTGIRRLGKRLLSEAASPVHLLFTHAHWDHLLGFPFFKPLYKPSYSMRLYGCPCAQSSVKEFISGTMAPPNFPVPLEDVHADVAFETQCDVAFNLGSVVVTPIRISHPNEGLGYKFEEDGRCFVFLTDNELGFRHKGGLATEDYAAFCEGADLLIHDAEFNPQEYQHTRTWGHSTYADVLKLALEAKVKALGLFHHNQDRSDDQIDAIADTCRNLIADAGAELECFAVAAGMERTI